jgi:hypothetical protein
MAGSERLPGKIVGHEPGAFYNRLAQTLGGYVRDVVDELARRGMVQTDAAGQPVVQVREASAIEGAAQIAVEADLRPIGLSAHTPLRASWEPGQGHITWRMHSAPITTTPCTWNPENAASSLTSDRLQAAYRRFLGREAPGRGR